MAHRPLAISTHGCSSLDLLDRRHLEGFPRVERFRAAEKLVSFSNTRPVPPNLSLATRRAIVADPAENAAIEALIGRFWGGRDKKGKLRWPKHWSTFPDARVRAQYVGPPWLEWYVRHYLA
jgi:hypothetical protein